MNHCGTCNACCRVFAIPPLAKPAGKWCTHCEIGVGCKIYKERPAPCVEFECVWLQSQKRTNPRERLEPELRPDKSKVVLSATTNPHILAATIMPGAAPDVWKKPRMVQLFATLIEGGMAVAIGFPAASTQLLLTPEGERTIEMTEPDETGQQWSVETEKETT